jgi:hypothetical protein
MPCVPIWIETHKEVILLCHVVPWAKRTGVHMVVTIGAMRVIRSAPDINHRTELAEVVRVSEALSASITYSVMFANADPISPCEAGPVFTTYKSNADRRSHTLPSLAWKNHALNSKQLAWNIFFGRAKRVECDFHRLISYLP